jgi:anionic cell wall polymer biosynthesis LytR-Cps2A-Psr (LCP) family protein
VRRNTKLDASIFLIAAIVLLMAGSVFVISTALRSDPIEEALSKNEVINVLLVFEGEEKVLSAFVLMYAPQNNRAAVIFVPGETGLILQSIDQVGSIDSVYDPKNIEPFRDEIENLLELTIKYSVVFEQEKFGRMVDLIGGVELFIPTAVEYYEEPPILFPSGTAMLDGDKAKQYLSFELSGEEQGEIYLRRERIFLGFLKSLGEQHTLLQNRAAGGLFYPLLKTEMSMFTRKRLFEALSALDMDRIGVQGIAGDYRDVSGRKLLLPSYNGTVIKDIVRQAQRSLSQQVRDSLAERMFTVEILNGTSVTGLAVRTSELIRGFRYDVVSTGNADRGDYEKTEVIDRSGIDGAADNFAGIIRCENIRQEARMPDIDLEYKADFTLILGKDFNGRIVTGNR